MPGSGLDVERTECMDCAARCETMAHRKVELRNDGLFREAKEASDTARECVGFAVWKEQTVMVELTLKRESCWAARLRGALNYCSRVARSGELWGASVRAARMIEPHEAGRLNWPLGRSIRTDGRREGRREEGTKGRVVVEARDGWIYLR